MTKRRFIDILQLVVYFGAIVLLFVEPAVIVLESYVSYQKYVILTDARVSIDYTESEVRLYSNKECEVQVEIDISDGEEEYTNTETISLYRKYDEKKIGIKEFSNNYYRKHEKIEKAIITEKTKPIYSQHLYLFLWLLTHIMAVWFIGALIFVNLLQYVGV